MDKIATIQFFATRQELWNFQNQYGASFGRFFRSGTTQGEHGETLYYVEEI